MIEYRDISKSYQDAVILDHINLTVNDGEFVVIVGLSGCGKTTTLKMMNRLIEMDSGDIFIDGKNIKDFDVVSLRTNIGYVIQQIGLFPNMTIEENICVVPKILKWDRARCLARTKELMALVNMPYDVYAKKFPSELSGGQQQRIGVLRALAAQPPIVLMDEPFGALDPITREVLQDEIKNLQKKLNITILFVTHDMGEAVKLADRIVFMENGHILQIAPPEEMLSNPASDTIRKFMGSNLLQKKGLYLTCRELMEPVSEDTAYEQTVAAADDARKAYQLLCSSESAYVTVVDEHGVPIGQISREGLGERLAEAVWGVQNDD